jgi:hypothetical protein
LVSSGSIPKGSRGEEEDASNTGHMAKLVEGGDEEESDSGSSFKDNNFDVEDGDDDLFSDNIDREVCLITMNM